jgi:hypothetical protein
MTSHHFIVDRLDPFGWTGRSGQIITAEEFFRDDAASQGSSPKTGNLFEDPNRPGTACFRVLVVRNLQGRHQNATASPR